MDLLKTKAQAYAAIEMLSPKDRAEVLTDMIFAYGGPVIDLLVEWIQADCPFNHQEIMSCVEKDLEARAGSMTTEQAACRIAARNGRDKGTQDTGGSEG